MEQKEHIATLCALGTVGAAAAGLAFATDQVESFSLRPTKRKWPGASLERVPVTSNTSTQARRSVTQPATPVDLLDQPTFPITSLGGKRLSSAPRFLESTRDDAVSEVPSSRGSSKSRISILRPRTATSRSTAEKRESTSSLWLKRLSSFSSRGSSPTTSSIQEKDEYVQPQHISTRPVTSAAMFPNKLVKRSVSQRAVSHDEAHGHILRRPATSHQRSQTFRDILAQSSNGIEGVDVRDEATALHPHTSATPTRLSWRPFFETNFPRKRRKSESATDSSQIRVVSLPNGHHPTMLLGSEMDNSHSASDVYDRPQPDHQDRHSTGLNFRSPRRSLASLRRPMRRRNFTDPSVQASPATTQGTFAFGNADNVSSQVSGHANFEVQLPSGTPQFAYSPPSSTFERSASFRPRLSMSTSDNPTSSSDAEGRVFSDADSLDFQSDTAYDSIATRATNGSHAAMQDSKLETIFAARTSSETETHVNTWQRLESNGNLEDSEMADVSRMDYETEVHGIGITLLDGQDTYKPSVVQDATMNTPPRSISAHTEDVNATPVALVWCQPQPTSSPPLLPTTNFGKDYEQVGDMLEDMKLDDNEKTADWSMAEDSWPANDIQDLDSRQIMSSPPQSSMDLIARFQEPPESDEAQRTSIFQWSENHQMHNFSRPRTVHGKHSNADRSRSSGRKGAPQLHFRSQSVPVNREAPHEELPTTSKYQTWRLGHKPISEEWSDDFDFDDAEPVGITSPVVDESIDSFRDSVRSVKIPQAIMDRQPSVHLQFGQVQEFMALVEELKRLRSKGAALRVLNGPARSLWEDADSIINLATINDDDDTSPRVGSSPPSSDPFAELPAIVTSTANNTVPAAHTRRPTITGRRSVSTMAAPLIHGRARGESLAHARHFLEAMYQHRAGQDSSPIQPELHEQKKLPFDTQDLKDLVVRSGAITRALKEEIRRAEGITVSPIKTPPRGRDGQNDEEHPLSEMFRVPPRQETSPCPPFRKPGFPKSRSANSYLDASESMQHSSPFSSPMQLAAVV